jgi:hypothetical protein
MLRIPARETEIPVSRQPATGEDRLTAAAWAIGMTLPWALLGTGFWMALHHL